MRRRSRSSFKYKDTDNDGFFDEITYDYDGDKTVESQNQPARLRQGHSRAAQPGQAPLGSMHDLHVKKPPIVPGFAQDLSRRVEKRADQPTDRRFSRSPLRPATSTHGYWLRERIFRLWTSVAARTA